MIPKPVIAGIAILGGAIVLIVAAVSGENENEDTSNDENPKEFNAEEVRRLRRQLKKQMRLKKRASTE